MFRRLLFRPQPAFGFSSHLWASQARRFSVSIPRNNYVRFKGPMKRPKNLVDIRSWDLRAQFAAILGLGGGIYYVSHLEQLSETGRWRFMNTSPEDEAKFAEFLRRDVRQQFQHSILPPEHPLTRYVHGVVKRILDASNLGSIRGEETPKVNGSSPDAEGQVWNPDVSEGAAKDTGASNGPKREWDVIVVDDIKVVNAMANPGIIIIFTGILPVCDDEQGLAAVLGHEIGHVVARHTAERMSASTLLIFGTALISLVLGLDTSISNLIYKFVMELPNSRKQELEADLIGLRLMSRACYDPAAPAKMFSRMAILEEKLGGHLKVDLLETHPSSEKRVKFLEEHLSEGYSIMESNPDCSFARGQLDGFRSLAREF